MKKPNKLFRLLFFTGIISLSLTACSDSDDPNESNTKHISQIVYTDNGETSKQSYIYDSAGRVISAIYSDNYESLKTTYTYEESQIVAKTSPGGLVETYLLDDGLITEYIQEFVNSPSSGHKCYYLYDADKKLNSIIYSRQGIADTKIVEWEDDNIISIEGSTYTYSNIPASKGFNSYHNIDWPLYEQGYYGKCSKDLFNSETRYDNTSEYKFDLKDGYVVKATTNNEFEYTIQWE